MLKLAGDFVRGLTGVQRLFAFIVLIVSCIVLIVAFSADRWTQLLVTGICVLLLWLGASVAMPAEISRDRLRRYSLYAALTITLAVPFSGGYGAGWAIDLARRALPENLAAYIPDAPSVPIGFVLVITWTGVVLLNWLWRDRTTTGRLSQSLKDEFTERTFPERLRLACEDLRNDLGRIDADTNWSHAHFVPLDAEVEVIGSAPAQRRVMDLLHAIRRDRRSRMFLVLGDPGAGKSVALRKLCRDLLDEVESSGRLPIYVSLKEWRTAAPWTRAKPPTVIELKAFILRNLTRRAPMSAEFLKTYFEKMIDRGHVFFVLDSFDEIPAVLDVDESSWLIRDLSRAITDLLAGGSEARGVVASRYFRRPRIESIEHRLLEIRPFSEEKVVAAVITATGHAERVKQAVFVTRPDLGAMVQNPFLLGLLVSYVDQNAGELPASPVDLYRSFVTARLDAVDEEMAEAGIDAASVLDTAAIIAREMFEADSFGLEMPIALLGQRITGRRIETVAEILASARIGRISAGGRAFSFVHRRFNEFFLVNRFRAEPRVVPLEAIPTDSRLRDAIALYTTIADPEEADRIARFCLAEMRPLISGAVFTSDAYRRGLHALRFLVDGFRGREHLLEAYQAELHAFIAERLAPKGDLLLAKNAVEAIGLTAPHQAALLTRRALALDNPWLLETTVRGVRYLSHVDDLDRALVRNYFLSLPRWALAFRYRQTIEILQLSRHFASTAQELKHFAREFKLLLYLTPAFWLIWPLTLGIALVVVFTATIMAATVLPSVTRQRSSPAARPGNAVQIAQAEAVPQTISRAGNLPQAMLQALPHLRNPMNAFLYALATVPPLIAIGLWAFRAVVEMQPAESWLRSKFPTDTLFLRENLSIFSYFILSDIVLSFVLILISIVLLPWFSLMLTGLAFMRNWRLFPQMLFIALFYFAIAYSGILGYIVGLIEVWRYFLFAFAAIGVFCIGALWLRAVAIYWRDRRDAECLSAGFDGRRATLAVALAQLRSDKGRLLLVTRIAASANKFRDVLAGTENRWPDGIRPNYGDRASTMLAQLDEVWLGLER